MAALAVAALAGGSAPAAPKPIEATEGAPFSGQVAALTAGCSNPMQVQATIAWGGGSTGSAAQVNQSGPQLTFSGSNFYPEEGSFAGTVTGSYFCDAGGTHDFELAFTGAVADAPLTTASGPSPPARVTTGHSVTTTATFTDADPGAVVSDYSAVINWGDGRVSPAIVVNATRGFEVTGAHQYASPGRYAVAVRIYDHGGARTAISGSLDVVPASPRIGIRRVRRVGNGTAVLSLSVTRPGSLTVKAVRRGHRLLIAGRHLRVRKSGPLVLVLRPTRAARLLLFRVHTLHLTTEVTFKPSFGPSIIRFIPIVFDLTRCNGSATFTYTGAEQSCVVPPGIHEVKVIAVGGRGGNVSEPCPSGLGCPYGNFGGAGAPGALVDSGPVRVNPGDALYVEVGGNGGDTSANEQVCCGTGSAGAGGWNGGGPGAFPSSLAGSGGGGGASDVQTVSCAVVCDQGLGFGVFISLASRVVVAGGGGGGGSGGSAGDGGGATQGGSGGFASWNGQGGNDAGISGNGGITGLGGGGAIGTAGGAGGNDAYDNTCNSGLNGKLGTGGAGGNDSDSSGYVDGVFVNGYAGGGGAGGFYGGGGGGGGCISLNNTIGAGGGGGGGSSNGPPGTTVQVNLSGAQPFVQVIPIG